MSLHCSSQTVSTKTNTVTVKYSKSVYHTRKCRNGQLLLLQCKASLILSNSETLTSTTACFSFTKRFSATFHIVCLHVLGTPRPMLTFTFRSCSTWMHHETLFTIAVKQLVKKPYTVTVNVSLLLCQWWWLIWWIFWWRHHWHNIMLRWWLQLDIWGAVFDSNCKRSFSCKAIRIQKYVLCVKPLRGVHTGSEASYPVAHLHVYLPVDSSKSAQKVSFWLHTWISLFWHLSNSIINRNNTVTKPKATAGTITRFCSFFTVWSIAFLEYQWNIPLQLIPSPV